MNDIFSFVLLLQQTYSLLDIYKIVFNMQRSVAFRINNLQTKSRGNPQSPTQRLPG